MGLYGTTGRTGPHRFGRELGTEKMFHSGRLSSVRLERTSVPNLKKNAKTAGRSTGVALACKTCQIDMLSEQLSFEFDGHFFRVI